MMQPSNNLESDEDDVKLSNKIEVFQKFNNAKKNSVVEYEVHYKYEVGSDLKFIDIEINTCIESESANAVTQTHSLISPINEGTIEPKNQITIPDEKPVHSPTRNVAINTIRNSSAQSVQSTTQDKENFTQTVYPTERLRNIDIDVEENFMQRFIVPESFHTQPGMITRETGSDQITEMKLASRKFEETPPSFAVDQITKADISSTRQEWTKLHDTDNEAVATSNMILEDSTKIKAIQSSPTNQTKQDPSPERILILRRKKTEKESSPQNEFNDSQEDADRNRKISTDKIEEKNRTAVEDEKVSVPRDTRDSTVSNSNMSYIEVTSKDFLKQTSFKKRTRRSRTPRTSRVPRKSVHRDRSNSRYARRPSMYRFVSDTTVTNQTINCIDALSRRSTWRNHGCDSLQLRDNFCCNSRTIEDPFLCSRISASTAGDYFVQSEGALAMEVDEIHLVENPVANQTSPYHHMYGLSRNCEGGSSNVTKFYELSPNNPAFAPYQKVFRHQHYGRKNNCTGYSMTPEVPQHCVQNRSNLHNAFNQYYLNCNRPQNVNTRLCCWCNTYSHNLHSSNMLYSTARSHIVYSSPIAYYYTFNSWC